jgi:hypothetical protein
MRREQSFAETPRFRFPEKSPARVLVVDDIV